jgi:hypothetical protein
VFGAGNGAAVGTNTILEGAGTSVVTVGVGITATLQNVRTTSGSNSIGGGITNMAELALHGCVIERNQAGTQGGGLLNWSGEAVLNDSTVARNTAPDGGGVLVRTDTVTLNHGAVNENGVNDCPQRAQYPAALAERNELRETPDQHDWQPCLAREGAAFFEAHKPTARVNVTRARRAQHATADRPRQAVGKRADAVGLVGAALLVCLAILPRRARFALLALLALPGVTVQTSGQHAGCRRGRRTQARPQGVAPGSTQEYLRHPVDHRPVHVAPPLTAVSNRMVNGVLRRKTISPLAPTRNWRLLPRLSRWPRPLHHRLIRSLEA